MNSILWIVFAACLAYKANAGYTITIDSIKSYTEEVEVTEDEPEKGYIKLTNHKNQGNSKFEAEFSEESEFDVITLNGAVCDVDNVTPEGFISKIFNTAVQVDNCPFPEGDLPVRREFTLPGDALEILSVNCHGWAIKAKVFSADSGGSGEEYVLWNIAVIYNDIVDDHTLEEI